MQELIKYIGDILNIKTESVYTIQDMTEELQKVKDIVAYRSYIKDHFYTLDYTTGYQKFIVLTENYLKLESDAEENIKGDEIRDNIFNSNKDKFLEIESKKFDTDTDEFRLVANTLLDLINATDLYSQSVCLIHVTGVDKVKFDIKKMLNNAVYTSPIKKAKKPYQELPDRLREMTKRIGN